MATVACVRCGEQVPQFGGWCPYCRTDQPLVSHALPVDNTFAWAIVAVPVVSLLLPLAFPGVTAPVLTLVMVVANTVLAVQDDKRIQAAGHEGVSPFWGFLLMPIYVTIRGRRTGNWAILLWYALAFLVYLAAVSSGYGPGRA